MRTVFFHKVQKNLIEEQIDAQVCSSKEKTEIKIKGLGYLSI